MPTQPNDSTINNLLPSAKRNKVGAKYFELSAQGFESGAKRFELGAKRIKVSAQSFEVSTKRFELGAKRIKFSAKHFELSAKDFKSGFSTDNANPNTSQPYSPII